LASVDGQKTGIIPANYVRVLGKRRGTKRSSRNLAKQTVTSDGLQQPQQLDVSAAADDVWSFDDVNC